MGKQAIDGDNNQTGQMVGCYSISSSNFASELKVVDAKLVTREVDGGLQTISINLPAIVTDEVK